MGLHDLQVVINASSTADKIYYTSLQQAQVAHAQNALHLNEQARLRQSQTQESTQQAGAKGVSEDDTRRREWKKEDFRQRAHSAKPEPAEKATPSPSQGNHIDIKA